MLTKDKKLLHEKYAEIYFDASTTTIVAKWKGFLKPEQVKLGCDIITDFIRKNPEVNHLSDHRELKILTAAVQEYITQWFVEVSNAGLQKIAVLVAQDIFASLSVEQVNETNRVGSLQIKTFDTHEKCIHFLTQEA